MSGRLGEMKRNSPCFMYLPPYRELWISFCDAANIVFGDYKGLAVLLVIHHCSEPVCMIVLFMVAFGSQALLVKMSTTKYSLANPLMEVQFIWGKNTIASTLSPLKEQG